MIGRDAWKTKKCTDHLHKTVALGRSPWQTKGTCWPSISAMSCLQGVKVR